MKITFLLALIISSKYMNEVKRVNAAEVEPLFYEWENDEILTNDMLKKRKNERGFMKTNNYMQQTGDHILYPEQTKQSKENKKVVKKKKHFFRGAVNKVWSWFGKKKVEESQIPGQQPVAENRHFLTDILKGIGNIFKRPAQKVVRRELPSQKRAGMIEIAALPQTVTAALKRGWVDARFGIMPEGAFVAGHAHDGTEIFVAKGVVNGTKSDVSPGTLKGGRRCVRLPVGKWSRCVFRYQILMGNSYIWHPAYYIKDKGWTLHPQAVLAGREGSKQNYICRAYEKVHVLIGKLRVDETDPDRRKCLIPYRGKSVLKETYEILIDWWD